MTDALVLDVALIVLFVIYLVFGARNGLSGSIFAILGVVAGAVAAFFFAPLVTGWMPVAWVRPGVSIAVTVLLVVVGHSVGLALGRRIRRRLDSGPVGWIDRVVGAIASVLAAALVASVLGASISQLGVPVLSRAAAGSTVLRTISTVTPDPVEAWVAQLKGIVADSRLPVISEALGGGKPVIPQLDTGNPQLNLAAQSVVRITGNAFACGVSQSGTGFVAAPERVITNAHVVAGVGEPVIEAPDGETIAGSIVYFDPVGDLAVIAVPGLTVKPLTLGPTVAEETDGALPGYPFGGPFTSGAAHIMRVGEAEIDDIYGKTSNQREVYTMAADVKQGNSGGPLLTLDGTVAGVVFAKSADTPSVGYAMTMAELDPVAEEAASLTDPVSSGDCITG